jgi:signal transduction histidine kinase
MLSYIIVDDSPLAQLSLEKLCQKNQSLKFVRSFLCPEAALQFLEKGEERVDLLFLDIEMPIMSGLQFLDKLATPPMVIFTTVDPMYAYEAFEHQAIDFLIKPITPSRFEQAVKKAIRASVLENKVNEIIESTRRLQEEKRSMVSLLAHDLRNPLFSLLVKAAQLKRNQPDDKIAIDIEVAINRIQHLITLILKIEEKEDFEVHKILTPVSLRPLIDKSLKNLEVLSSSKKLKIGINEVVPNALVMAESILLEHILENILSNAIKYSPVYGMIEIYIEEIEHDLIKVRIIDDGPGIDPEKHEGLFDKKEVDITHEGIGIGLSLSKKFADLMNIQMGIYNSETFGATAYLDLKKAVTELHQDKNGFDNFQGRLN